MYRRYRDILSRIAEEPAWFDEHAVPRYGEFAPDKIANIYADEAALAEVTCQCCRHVFRVAFSQDNNRPAEVPSETIAEAIRARTLHFGDPPNFCCDVGASMNSEPRRVVEYWRRHDSTYTWRRDSSFEVDIRPDWVEP